MRDPKRIEPFMDRLAELWAEKVPDWRFGQLVSNFVDFVSGEGINFFYAEDDMLLELVEKFFSVRRY